MMVQSLLRHAMAEAISEGFINCLIVTSVADANIQLSRIHEHIFTRKFCLYCFFVFYFVHALLLERTNEGVLSIAYTVEFYS